MNDGKETDATVFVRGFRISIGRLELFPFQLFNPACIQSQAQGHLAIYLRYGYQLTVGVSTS